MNFYRISGILLIAISILGFFTVADEFRHTGELIGVTGILLAGIVLLVAGFDNPVMRRLNLGWLAIGIGIGTALGAAMDNMPVGLAIGIAVGLVLAVAMRKRKK